MKNLSFLFAFSIMLAACSGRGKKILLYASSAIQADNTQKNITVTDGTTHQEKELEFSGSGPVEINVQSPAGKFTLEATGEGYFLANLKPDTVVGSLQHIGSDTSNNKITQEHLKQMIDSLEHSHWGKTSMRQTKTILSCQEGLRASVKTQTRSKSSDPMTKSRADLMRPAIPKYINSIH